MFTPSLRHLFHPDNSTSTSSRSGAGPTTSLPPSAGSPARAPAPRPTRRRSRSPTSTSTSRSRTSTTPSTSCRRVYLDDAIWFHEPTYAAHLNCPVVIPALLAELFISVVNSCLDTFDQSVGGTLIERHLVDWTAARIGFPTRGAGEPGRHRADGIFTSGGTQSNLQALLLARDTAVARTASARTGCASWSPPTATSASRSPPGCSAWRRTPSSGAVRRAAPDAGAGARSRPSQQCLDDDLVPMAVVATAGTTDFGAIDPLRRVAGVCDRFGVWLHVDAAYGGGLLASRRRRHLLDGIELADSVTIDFHKTWFLPVSCERA